MITTIYFTKNGVVHDITLVEDNTRFYRYSAKCDCKNFIAVQNSLELMNYEIDKHKAYDEQRTGV